VAKRVVYPNPRIALQWVKVGVDSDGDDVYAPLTGTVSGLGAALQFDGSASPLLYLGEAEPGSLTSAAVWRIQRFDTTVGVKGLWAAGVSTFSQVWDNRAALAYS
jgi:hypothetical protein